MVEAKSTTVSKATGPYRPRTQSTDTLTPKEVFGILRRHILFIIVMTFLGLGIGGSTWYLLRRYLPKYTAQTYIEVMPPVETDPMTIVAAQVQKDIQYGYRVTMANLIKQQRTLQELLRRDKVRETEWFKQRGEDIRRAVKYLRKNLGIYPHRDAEYVEISMTCRSAKESALIVNELANLFWGSRGGTEKTEISETLTQLEERKADVDRDIRIAESALQGVRDASGITDLESPMGRYFQHTITLRLNDLELQEDQLKLAVQQLRADIENLKELAMGPISVQVEYRIERDPVLILLAQQIAIMEAQLSSRLSKFGENHRVVRQTQELINEIKEKRRLRKIEIAEQTRQASLKNARDGLVILQERLAELENMRAEAAAKQKELDKARVQYEQRLKIRDERVAMLDAIKEQIEKYKIMLNDPKTPKVQPLGPAPEPLEMDASRQWWFWFPGGTMLGLLFGITFSFLIEMLNDLVRTPRDVARFLHIPLLGVIPDADEDSQIRGVDLCHVVHQAPYSIISESYRRFRTNLELSNSVKTLKTVLITSGGAAEGKTCATINLAASLVAKNKKVLVIDANFRRPSLQALFPRTKSNSLEAENLDLGLSNFLMDQCTSMEAIRPSGIEGLDIIDSGPLPANPAELLAGYRMEALLKEQAGIYDHIIIDSPPVLLVSDTKVLAKLVGATVLIFNAAATSRGAAQRTIYELREVGASIVGCVLFAAKAIKGGYFHEQFKSYRKYQKAELTGAV